MPPQRRRDCGWDKRCPAGTGGGTKGQLVWGWGECGLRLPPLHATDPGAAHPVATAAADLGGHWGGVPPDLRRAGRAGAALHGATMEALGVGAMPCRRSLSRGGVGMGWSLCAASRQAPAAGAAPLPSTPG